MLPLSIPFAMVAPAAQWSPALRSPHAVGRRGFKVGLGKVLTTRYGGEIFGFDLDQTGTDGILTEAPSFGSAVESFDATTGKITRVIKKIASPSQNDELVTYGIFANDLGFVDLERVSFASGHVDRNDRYYTLAPVTGGKVNGMWKHPHTANTIIWAVAPNQATQTQAVLAYQAPKDPNDLEIPWLYVADFATGTTTRYRLDVNLFGVADEPQVAEDTATGQAVFALTPDAGRVGGLAPVNVLVDLQSGKHSEFTGLNNGPYGSGDVNGLAVDSNTGVACTTTELNAQVEFYNLAHGTGIAAQLPGTSDVSEYNSAETVANDSLNGLFLVAQTNSSSAPSGSTIYAYDASGTLVETINGFNFSNGDGMHLVPSARMGYVNGPGANQLQQFFY